MDEFSGAALGDPRLTKRLIRLVDDLSAQPTQSIPLACGGWAETKAAYRLLDNEAVDWRAVLAAHGAPTVARMGQEARVLCLQDTTELDFTSQPGIAGLGRLSYARQHGRYLHPTLAVSEGGVALGVLDAWRWARKPQGEVDIKESRRWTEGYERIAELAERLPDTRLVYVADRESDLRELIDRAADLGHPADYLLRAKHDRVLAEGGKLRAAVARQAVLGAVAFAVPAAPGRTARTCVQTVRVARVTLARHAGKTHEVTVILAREAAPGRRAADRMAAADQRIGHDAGRRRAADRMVSAALADGDLLPHRQERLPGGVSATRHRRASGAGLGDLPDHRLAHPVSDDPGAGLPRAAVRCGLHRRGVARRLADDAAPAATGCAAHPRRDDLLGGRLRRLPRPPGRRAPGPKALWEGLMKLMSYVEALQTVHEVYGPSATCG
jgi:hypothetical protein